MRNIWLLFLSIICACCTESVTYLDDDYPDIVPKKYAVGIINIDGRFQQNLTMSPDGKEQLFTVTDSELWRYETIMRVRTQHDEVRIDTPRFVTGFEFENEWFIGEAMIASDNRDLYFIADYPPDLWNTKRTDNGSWSKPVKLDSLSTEKDDWYPTLSKDNTLYFTNGTLYKSTRDNGNYLPKTKVEAPFNQEDIRDVCISPDESYMIFTSSDSLGYGQSDLYISFIDGSGNWSEAQNLGSEINTNHLEFAPYISPDEKFLFFSRRDTWQNAGFSSIYWVSLSVIDEFRNHQD